MDATTNDRRRTLGSNPRPVTDEIGMPHVTVGIGKAGRTEPTGSAVAETTFVLERAHHRNTLWAASRPESARYRGRYRDSDR